MVVGQYKGEALNMCCASIAAVGDIMSSAFSESQNRNSRNAFFMGTRNGHPCHSAYVSPEWPVNTAKP
jgi:hypothetical protein